MAANDPFGRRAPARARVYPTIGLVALLWAVGASGITAGATDNWIRPACEAWRDSIEQTAAMLRRDGVLTERMASEVLLAAYDLQRRCAYEPSKALLGRFAALMTLLETVAANGQD